MKLIPWRLGLRNARLVRGLSVATLLVVMTVVALAFGLATIRATARFTPAEVSGFALGRADLLVRANPGDPLPDAATRERLGVEDLLVIVGIDTTLTHGDTSTTLTGRVVDYLDPITEGMTVPITVGHGRHELALSPAAATALHVTPGDTVDIAGAGGAVTVQFTDILAVADLDFPIFFLQPGAVSAEQLRAIESASDRQSDRWLLRAPDTASAVSYFHDRGLQVSTPGGYEGQEPATLVNLDVILAVAAVVGIGVLGAGIAASSRERRAQGDVLYRLGAPLGQIRGLWMVQTAAAAIPGSMAGLAVGWLVAVIGVASLSRAAHQDWGPLEPAWTVGTVGAGVALVAAVGLVGAMSPGRTPTPARLHDAATRRGSAPRRVLPGVLATRLRRQTRRATLVGMIVIACACGLGGGIVIVMDGAAVRISRDYVAPIPSGSGAVTLPRSLTTAEIATIAAATNTAVLEDRRAAYITDPSGAGVPVFIDNAFTRCQRNHHDDECVTQLGLLFPRTVVIVADAPTVEGYLGRNLTSAESQSFLQGDGLLLASGDADSGDHTVRIIGPPGYDVEDYSRAVSPVAIDGFVNASQMPGLMISPQAAEQWELFADTSEISRYLLRPTEAEAVTEEALRAALPADVRASADVLVEAGPPIGTFAAIAHATLIAACLLAFVVTMLLVSTWANDCSTQFRTLHELGVGPGRLRQILTLRVFQSLGTSMVLGVGLSYAAAWGFLHYAGVDLELTGWQWVLPALAISVSGLSSSLLFAPVGSPQQ